MRSLITTVFVAVIMVSLGCDVDIHESGTAPAANPTAPTTAADGVSVDVGDTPAENRLERREERRENLREAIDEVDVEVGNGSVKVDVDGE